MPPTTPPRDPAKGSRDRPPLLRGWGRTGGHRRPALIAVPPQGGPSPALLSGTGIHGRPPARAVLVREQRYRFALLGADLLSGLVALEIALAYFGSTSFFRAALLALPLTVLLAKIHGLYDRDDLLVRKSTIEELPRLFQHATLATLLLVLLDEPLGIGQTSDDAAALLLVLLLSLALVGRMLARRLAGRLSPPERCLVLGDAHVATELRGRTEGRPGIQILGAAPLQGLRDYTDLCHVIDEFGAERVIIVQSSQIPQQQTLELVRVAKLAGVRVSLMPGILGVVGSQVEFDDVFGVTLLGVRQFGLTRSSRALKRSFDLACALPLLVLLSPVIALCALLVKRDGGPVFFRQERVGLRGRRFQIIKLRTMVDGAEAMRDSLAAHNEAGDGLFKIAADPRITAIGATLRRTHLDELPQLWNVVRGEMSLVGPRPLVSDEDARITGLDRRRLELTPGMTGPWQILGSHRRIPMPEMVKIDYLYAASWSLWNDAKILLRTAATVARRGGV